MGPINPLALEEHAALLERTGSSRISWRTSAAPAGSWRR